MFVQRKQQHQPDLLAAYGIELRFLLRVRESFGTWGLVVSKRFNCPFRWLSASGHNVSVLGLFGGASRDQISSVVVEERVREKALSLPLVHFSPFSCLPQLVVALEVLFSSRGRPKKLCLVHTHLAGKKKGGNTAETWENGELQQLQVGVTFVYKG